MLKMTPAQAKIREVFFDLLKQKPYTKIKVSEIVQAAQINRSTFYRNYEDIYGLYNAICFSLIHEIISLKPGDLQDAEAFRLYCKNLYLQMLAHAEEIALLSWPNGDIRFLWKLGEAYQKRLTAIAAKYRLEDDAVERNIQLSAGFICTKLSCQLYNDAVLPFGIPSITEDPNKFEWDLTVFENIAGLFQRRFGGNREFHYALILAYVKLFPGFFAPNPSVTDLLQAAGISRTEFYLYFKNFDDFKKAYIDALVDVVVNFSCRICLSTPETAVSIVTSFTEINYNFVQSTMKEVFSSGSLIAYFSTLVSMVQRLIKNRMPASVTPTDEQDDALLYYVGSVASYCLTYYIGLINEQALLDGVKRAYYFGIERTKMIGVVVPWDSF